MDEWSEPYSEQVVLMEGQGIWYFRPSIEGDLIKANLQTQVAPPRQFTKADFDLAEESFVYFLPQSTFKIHPLYDLVLRDILSRAPDTAWLVVMGGHRPKWTETYRHRLHSAFGPSLSQRLCIISRVSSEQFTALLNIADVILHPFPFDGSKTSADALSVGKPLVTLPTEYLRGRMGAAFLRTMNIPELVARSANEYVDIAVALASDVQFYDRVSALIVQRVDLIWEDMQVPYTWSQFLSNALQLPLLSWEDFLMQQSGTGRNYSEDASRARMREENSRSFDRAWGPEHWLVGRDGAVHLESTLADAVDEGEASAPCIFRNWHCGPYLSAVGEEHSPHQNTYYSTESVVDSCLELISLAVQSISEGDFVSAARHLRSAVNRDPRNSNALQLLGTVYCTILARIYLCCLRFAENATFLPSVRRDLSGAGSPQRRLAVPGDRVLDCGATRCRYHCQLHRSAASVRKCPESSRNRPSKLEMVR